MTRLIETINYDVIIPRTAFLYLGGLTEYGMSKKTFLNLRSELHYRDTSLGSRSKE